MNKLIKRLIPLSIIVVSIFIVQALVAAKPTLEKKPKQQRVVSLFVDEVQAESVKLSVTSHGEVKPQTEIDLTALVSGQVISISKQFTEGAAFETLSTLIKIDDTDYKVAVIRAQAQVASAQVNVEKELANSKIKKEQWKRKNNKAKPTDYALNIPQVAEAQAMLMAAEADLQAANLKLARTEIKAPFKGRVLTENISIGQYITPATVLGHIFSTDIVEVRLPLTDTQLSELSLPMGYMANNQNGPVVTFSAIVGNNPHQWQGQIVRTNASIDKDTRLIYAIAEMYDPYGVGADDNTSMAVGMYVTANINSNRVRETLSIPRIALHNSNKVYVINNESKLEIREVEVLSTSIDVVYVTSGVVAGENVVTSTVPVIIDGMKVNAIKREQQQSQLIAQAN